MEMYDVETLHVKQRKILQEIYEYVSAAALVKDLYSVESDIMHVMEYVWQAGTALHGEKGAGRNPWVREHALAIVEGRVGRVIGGLKQILTKKNLRASQVKALKKAITYFGAPYCYRSHRRNLRIAYQRSSGSKRFALVIRWDTGSAQFESSDEKRRLG